MVSPRLQHDIDRRVRAAYSLDQDRGLCDDTHRTPSVPGALRHHRREESHRAVTAPAGYRGRRGSTARARLILLAKHVRTARSESPPPMQCGRERRTGQRIPSTTGPRASAAASVLDAEAPLPSEDSSSGIGTGDQSEQGSPLLTADVREKAGSREKEGAVTSDFGTPKLMELMEERDRAVHLCLQVPPVCALWDIALHHVHMYVVRLEVGVGSSLNLDYPMSVHEPASSLNFDRHARRSYYCTGFRPRIGVTTLRAAGWKHPQGPWGGVIRLPTLNDQRMIDVREWMPARCVSALPALCAQHCRKLPCHAVPL